MDQQQKKKKFSVAKTNLGIDSGFTVTAFLTKKPNIDHSSSHQEGIIAPSLSLLWM